ncbi:hypothetical protein [Pseudomonas sp. C11]|uniref:hypothetical protein n=1 Tax=Pseudomonas sp. C11 TaxID=3075550 RepID=UPI002AFE1929|nr:hypothetical protein [Pseudomonas sp. C11]
MAVKPIGEAVFEAAGQTYRIAASELKQHDLVKNSSGLFKGDTEDWSVSFTAAHALGEFTWLVSYSLGGEGVSLDTYELVKQPAGVEMVSAMRFQQAEEDD